MILLIVFYTILSFENVKLFKKHFYMENNYFLHYHKLITNNVHKQILILILLAYIKYATSMIKCIFITCL